MKNALKAIGPVHVPFSYEGRSYGFDHANEIDHIAKCQANAGTFYERPLLEELRRRLEDRPGIILDVGAHVGNHAVYFAAVMGRTVIAFEPNPYVLPHLAHNVLTNGVEDRVTILGCAAGSGASTWCTVRNDHPSDNTGMCRVAFDRGRHLTLTLDDAAWGEDIALIKIDAEGSELDILHGTTLATKGDPQERPLLALEAQTPAALEAQRLFLANRYTPSERSWGSTPVHIWTATKSAP